MTPSLSRYFHIYHALSERSPEWADAHKIRYKNGVILFQQHHGVITRTIFAAHESEGKLVIVSALSAKPVAESTLLAWMLDPEGLRGLA